MDIDLLSKMVKELILDDDKVVLPGLGCFVAEIVPAYFSDKGYTINPPYRKLYFRARPDEGDSLINFYAKSNDVPREVAERIIRDFVSELKAVLHAKKVVVFPGLGRLRATKENNVFFIADEELDIYPEGFGMEPISLKTHKETAAEVSAAVADLKTMLETVPDIEILVEPAPEPDPEPDPEPEKNPVTEDTPAHVEKKSAGIKWGKVFWVLFAVLVLLVVAYMVVGRLCPEWIDQFLFTPEELDILNR